MGFVDDEGVGPEKSVDHIDECLVEDGQIFKQDFCGGVCSGEVRYEES